MLGYDYENLQERENVIADALSHQFEEESTLLIISLPIPEWIEEARATLGKMRFVTTRTK